MLSDIKKVKDQVSLVLEEFPETRDSDKSLIIRVLTMFYGLELSYLQKEKIRNAPSFESIRRTRQKFQEGGSFRSNVEMERKVEETRVRGDIMQGKLL